MRTVVVACCGLLLPACVGDGSDPTAATSARVPATSVSDGPSASVSDGPTTGPTTDASTPPSAAPSTTASTTSVVEADGLPVGFDLVVARVTEPDGTTCDLCLWLASTADQRSRGLMHVTDLGPAAGMAFRYDRAHTGTFWMKNTVLPLSIAFFAPEGGYMTEFDMEPCTTPTCRRYGTPSGFLVAVETLQGGLGALGMAPGSRLELLDEPCDLT